MGSEDLGKDFKQEIDMIRHMFLITYFGSSGKLCGSYLSSLARGERKMWGRSGFQKYLGNKDWYILVFACMWDMTEDSIEWLQLEWLQCINWEEKDASLLGLLAKIKGSLTYFAKHNALSGKPSMLSQMARFSFVLWLTVLHDGWWLFRCITNGMIHEENCW